MMNKYPRHQPDFEPITTEPMNHLSLFTGYGGADIAGEWAGMRTVAMCERDEFAQRILKQNYPGIKIYDDVFDITKGRLDEDKIPAPSIITAGSPCQSVSSIGCRRGESDARNLFGKTIEIIDEIRPRWAIIENVANLEYMGLPKVLLQLERAGYIRPQAFFIPAYACNAVHERYRVFIVGFNSRFNGGRYSYLDKSGKIERDISPDSVSPRWSPNVSEQTRWAANAPRIAFNEGRLDKPPVCRVVPGLKARISETEKAAIKAAGNGIVPQQIYPLMRYIKYIDDIILADIKDNCGGIIAPDLEAD